MDCILQTVNSFHSPRIFAFAEEWAPARVVNLRRSPFADHMIGKRASPGNTFGDDVIFRAVLNAASAKGK
jgi:hypothetical protein